ncbi:hypothetical protein F4Z99_17465 [Candidatus Poribacteria bacterium]|nr:hypothetical protein [Candidatus Poribacteria bacterium]
MKSNPELRNDLYRKVRKNFPNELPFPERFNLKLTEASFEEGNIRLKKSDTQKIVDWQGNPIEEKPITVLEYQAPSRLDCAIRNSFPKSFNPLNVVHSYFYNNIEVGTSDESLDLEYNLTLHPADKRVETMLLAFDINEVYHKSFYGDTLKIRIQYAERIVNSAGPRFDLYGYIYIPQKKKPTSTISCENWPGGMVMPNRK